MEDLRADQPAVLISGSASGIGWACVEAMTAEGWHVFAGYRQPEDATRLTAAFGGRVTPVRLDVTHEPDIQNAVDSIRRNLSRTQPRRVLRALINNAGLVVAGPLETLPPGDLALQWAVNVQGAVRLTQCFLPLLKERPDSRVVFMGSISGLMTLPVTGAYSISKHALEAVANAFRLELKPWRVHVSLLEPGPIRTPIWSRAMEEAAERAERLNPRVLSAYAGLMNRVRALAADSAGKAPPPSVVASQAVHALTAVKPAIRYFSGRGIRLKVALSRLPARLQDALILRRLQAPLRFGVGWPLIE
ncbi:MAG: SDR family NAD(P)-dependent oxidoreductase [Candidatus Melainabacteria bacterium]